MAFTVTTIGANNTQAVNASVRTATLNESAVEYATFFSEFDDAELLIDKENNALKFSGTKTLSSDLFEEIDLVGMTGNDSDGIAVRYIFDYNANTNEFYLSVIADMENGEIIDKWFGVPFTDENGEIDIAFATDDGIIYLSELQDSGVLENCGWFSRILKKVAKVAAVVAAVAVVVAVVVVAAPAVAAAATTVSTAVAVGGGAAAFTTGTATAAVAAAAAAGAAAMGTTAFAIAATTASIATCVALTSYIAEKYLELTQEFVLMVKKKIETNKGLNGRIYYPCMRVSEGVKVQVLSVPVNAEVAVAWIKLGGNMYTYFQDDAAGILSLAGFTPSICPSLCPSQRVGNYRHFHPFKDNVEVKIAGDGKRVIGPKHSIHSFFGLPI